MVGEIMEEFVTGSVLEVLDNVAAESTKAVKLMLLEDAIDDISLVMSLRLMSLGVFTKPKIVFNTFTSDNDFNDIVKYFHTKDVKGIPQNTLRLLAYISDTNSLGLTRGDIVDILDTTIPIDVYKHLGMPNTEDSCNMCETSEEITDGICSFCEDSLMQLTLFRSDNSFSAILTPENYGRSQLLNEHSNFGIVIGNYKAQVVGSHIMFNRVCRIYDAQLPFIEYQVRTCTNL